MTTNSNDNDPHQVFVDEPIRVDAPEEGLENLRALVENPATPTEAQEAIRYLMVEGLISTGGPTQTSAVDPRTRLGSLVDLHRPQGLPALDDGEETTHIAPRTFPANEQGYDLIERLRAAAEARGFSVFSHTQGPRVDEGLGEIGRENAMATYASTYEMFRRESQRLQQNRFDQIFASEASNLGASITIPPALNAGYLRADSTGSSFSGTSTLRTSGSSGPTIQVPLYSTSTPPNPALVIVDEIATAGVAPAPVPTSIPQFNPEDIAKNLPSIGQGEFFIVDENGDSEFFQSSQTDCVNFPDGRDAGTDAEKALILALRRAGRKAMSEVVKGYLRRWQVKSKGRLVLSPDVPVGLKDYLASIQDTPLEQIHRESLIGKWLRESSEPIYIAVVIGEMDFMGDGEEAESYEDASPVIPKMGADDICPRFKRLVRVYKVCLEENPSAPSASVREGTLAGPCYLHRKLRDQGLIPKSTRTGDLELSNSQVVNAFDFKVTEEESLMLLVDRSVEDDPQSALLSATFIGGMTGGGTVVSAWSMLDLEATHQTDHLPLYVDLLGGQGYQDFPIVNERKVQGDNMVHRIAAVATGAIECSRKSHTLSAIGYAGPYPQRDTEALVKGAFHRVAGIQLPGYPSNEALIDSYRLTVWRKFK